MERVSEHYFGTFAAADLYGNAIIDNLRQIVSSRNKTHKRKLRVVLRGRKPHMKKLVYNQDSNRYTLRSYDNVGNIVNGLKNASVFDVYIYNRYN